jgi:hypothetical protein
MLTRMPEVGQTILHVDQVGFQRLPDVPRLDNLGMPIPGPKEQQYAILLQDSSSPSGDRVWVIPIADNVRKVLIDAMRRAPLEVVGHRDNGAQEDAKV